MQKSAEETQRVYWEVFTDEQTQIKTKNTDYFLTDSNNEGPFDLIFS